MYAHIFPDPLDRSHFEAAAVANPADKLAIIHGAKAEGCFSDAGPFDEGGDFSEQFFLDTHLSTLLGKRPECQWNFSQKALDVVLVPL